MQMVRIKSQWPEAENFSLFRADTGEEYIYIHFLTPVELVLKGKRNVKMDMQRSEWAWKEKRSQAEGSEAKSKRE